MKFFNSVAGKRDVFCVLKPEMKLHCETDHRACSYIRYRVQEKLPVQ